MRRLTNALRRFGCVDGFLYAASRAFARATGGRIRLLKYYFVVQPVPRETADATNRSGRLQIAEVGPGDLLTRHFPRPPAVIARRYADGAVCLVATRADDFVGFLWLQFGSYDEDEVRCRYVMLPSDASAWDFDIHIEPAFRMSRAFVRLWDAANETLRRRNVEWTFSRISAFNPDSLRAHARIGGRPIAWALFLCWGSIQLMLAGIRPWLHLSSSEGSRPELTLHAPAIQ